MQDASPASRAHSFTTRAHIPRVQGDALLPSSGDKGGVGSDLAVTQVQGLVWVGLWRTLGTEPLEAEDLLVKRRRFVPSRS